MIKTGTEKEIIEVFNKFKTQNHDKGLIISIGPETIYRVGFTGRIKYKLEIK